MKTRSEWDQERARKLMAEWAVEAERAATIAGAFEEAAEEHRRAQYSYEDKVRALDARMRLEESA